MKKHPPALVFLSIFTLLLGAASIYIALTHPVSKGVSAAFSGGIFAMRMLLGLGSLASGIGLWRSSPWARITTILCLAVIVLAQLFGAAILLIHHIPFPPLQAADFAGFLTLGVCVWGILYLSLKPRGR